MFAWKRSQSEFWIKSCFHATRPNPSHYFNGFKLWLLRPH
uniref:Uncharacterized protein n=1 Tax=Anguilla anguilla TaxID=7936 RepID=A0A0E9V0K2_ANGAN